VRVDGSRVVLLVFPRDDEACRAMLGAFARAYPRIRELGALVLATTAGSNEVNKGLVQAQSLPFVLFSDPGSEMYGAFAERIGGSVSGPICIVTDGNQRVLGRIEPGPVGETAEGFVGRVLAWLEAEPVAPGLGEVGALAPVLIVPNVLDRDFCAGLIERWHSDHIEGVVSTVVDGRELKCEDASVKRRRDHRITDQTLYATLVGMVTRRILPEMHKAFCQSRFIVDRFVVTCYDAERGDCFRMHRDNFTPATQARMFALTLNLNSEEHEGGGLRFPEYGPTLYKPPTGGAIVFSCSLLHEATPVTRGRRFTLLSFLRDPDASQS
jgi:predicted 2-oxoglutarate/Fe(II)-dependent dioxygenase YbiX/peroxiredoxin